MGLKKRALAYLVPYAFSRRKKVVSDPALVIGVSLVALSLILLTLSLVPPLNKPVFHWSRTVQGPFSLGSRPHPSSNTFSSSYGVSSSSAPTAQDLERHEELFPPFDRWRDRMIRVRNRISETGTRRSSTDSIGEGVGSEETPFGNSLDDVKNGSLFNGEGRTGNNVNVSAEDNAIAEKTVEDKLIGTEGSEGPPVNNGTVSTENFIDCNTEIGENNSEGNLFHNGDNLISPARQQKELEVKEQRHFDENDNLTVSQNDSQSSELRNSSYSSCDIFDGRWVKDDFDPYYPPGSCPYIDRDFNCHNNGRPDDEFLKWRWQPYGCDIPRLNATDFLERLRGKKLVFVGDSLNRNMWESLVCILHNNIQNKESVYEISGRKDFKKRGVYAFRFEDYNCTVDFVGSPFLVRESSFKGGNGTLETLRLDLMDQTTSVYHDADFMVFNTGHWWTHAKTSKGENYYKEGDHVHSKLKALEAYKKALTTWAKWVKKNVDRNRTQVFFRGYSLTHFSGGRWNSGGQCHKETQPITDETYLTEYPSKMRVLEDVLQETRLPVTYLNVSRLTDYRKDGHPSIYRKAYMTTEEQIASGKSQDCSHWCLPGVPDTWNELLYASLLSLE